MSSEKCFMKCVVPYVIHLLPAKLSKHESAHGRQNSDELGCFLNINSRLERPIYLEMNAIKSAFIQKLKMPR